MIIGGRGYESDKDQSRKSRLNPDRDADEIIRLGLWQPYRKRIIRSGKWKCYKQGNGWVTYTFEEAARIEEHQKLVTQKLLGELYEQFKPLPPLNDEKKENERLYWERIRREIKQRGWDKV
jgi:hypothetical protein